MAVLPVTRLGPYEIEFLLGAGGMGQVYRARDTRLDRVVAIKILPAGLGNDPTRRERFNREARAVSSLSHPHICSLYDAGRDNDVEFLVMEYLEGETLADRLLRGPLPTKEVLRVASEIADALDCTHRADLVHRDLKPSNIMLTRSGAKLLDFGLARLSSKQSGHGASTLSAECDTLTAEGAILGTFRYMAPEQLEGKEADARTDVFALGTVAYEMATGRKAFEGDSQASLIATIMSVDPPPISSSLDVNGLMAATLNHVVERCLAKDPDARWQTARDVKLELDWIAQSPSCAVPAVEPPTRRQRKWWAWAATGVASLVVLAPAVMQLRLEPSAGAQARLAISLPRGTALTPREIVTELAVSPDGRHVVFVALNDGSAQLWVRSLDSPTARPLQGTDGAFSPFWSPDSRFIGFAASGALKRIALSGGPPQTICEARVDSVPSWGSQGTILFASSTDSDHPGIYRVPANGGTREPVTTLDTSQHEVEHYWPHFLPDGRHFFYLALSPRADGRGKTRSVYLGSVDSNERVRQILVDVDSRIVYSPPGHVLYVREGTLLAQPFDLSTLQVGGDPVLIADGVHYYRPTGLAEFSVSQTGLLAYRGSSTVSNLLWFDRAGRKIGSLGTPGPFRDLRLSPDEKRLAVDLFDARLGSVDIWIYDLETGIPTRFASELETADHPIWSDDGRRLIFRSSVTGAPDLYRKPWDAAGAPELIEALDRGQLPEDSSLDGRYLAYSENTRTTGSDLWLLPLVGERAPMVFLRTPFEEGAAKFSPDGRWVAFVSTDSGESEVYVAAIGEASAKRRVSSAGGEAPRWRGDGRELFYLAPDNTVMAVDIHMRPRFEAGVPRPLFVPGRVFRRPQKAGHGAYDVTGDGQRFVVNILVEDDTTAPINVVLNWSAGLPDSNRRLLSWP